MKVSIRRMHSENLAHILSEGIMAALVLTLSFAATSIALMFVIGRLSF